MSFSSFNLFNFFQQPNTGRPPNVGEPPNTALTSAQINIIKSGNGASGTVADFNWYFPYATNDVNGRIPPAIFEGGFVIGLYSDSIFSGQFSPFPSSVGLHYGIVQNDISGNAVGNSDTTNLTLSFSGTWEPVITGIYTTFNKISGNVIGMILEASSGKIIVSGNALGFDTDTLKVAFVTSGSVYQDFNLNTLTIHSSGNIFSGVIDSAKINTALSGNYYSLIGDACNISYGWSGYSSSTGGQTITTTGQIFMDSANITYMFISYSQGNN